MRHVLIIFLKMYQWLVSPIVHTLCGPGFGCRYEESCSSFAIRSVKERGAWFGGRQSLRRVFRCQNVFGIVAVIFCALPLGAVASPTLGDGPAWISGWQLPSHESALEDLLHKKEVLQLGFDQSEFLYLKNVQSPWRTQGDSKVWRFEDENVILERQVTPDEKTGTWGFNAKGVFKKTSKLPRPKHLFLSVESVFNDQDVDAQDRQLVWYVQQNIERQGLQKTFTTRSSSEGLRWVGFQNRYFAVALLPEGAGPWSGLMQSLYEEQSAGGRASLVTPVQGDAFDVRFRVFFGPQDLSLLQKADKSLDILVDFGWFTIIAYPLLKAMKWFYAFVGNYGIAIILLTLLIKLLTYPLTYKSMKSMKEMAKLQPEIQKLKEKHGDNKEALNREMLTIMRTHGYNPMAGCLPILVQMPVFFALYQVLYKSVELYRAPFGLWIQDLSVKDPFFVTPIILTGVMFVQQKMTPMASMDPTQQKMMQFMPILFGLMMLTLPSGLTLYMLVNTVVSIVQQKTMQRRFEAKRA